MMQPVVNAMALLTSPSLSKEVQKEETESETEDVIDVQDSEFLAATAYVSGPLSKSLKLNNEQKLLFYGFFKQAKFGSCTEREPSRLDMQAHAKWDAWSKVKDLSRDEAKQGYVELLDKLESKANWRQELLAATLKPPDDIKAAIREPGVDSIALSAGQSRPIMEEPEVKEADKTLCDYAEANDFKTIQNLLAKGVSINFQDSEKRTALHFAVDRGHVQLVGQLLELKANVNQQDGTLQTPLHYATLCEQVEIAVLLMAAKADPTLKDKDGETPCDTASPQIAEILKSE